MYSVNGEQFRRSGDSITRLDEAEEDDEDLNEESVSLANELLPEFYDIGGSVRSQEIYRMERPYTNDTRLIIHDLIDRVERLSRENSLLRQVNTRNGALPRDTLDNDYMTLPCLSTKPAIGMSRSSLLSTKFKDYPPMSTNLSNSFDRFDRDTLATAGKDSYYSRDLKFTPSNYSTPAARQADVTAGSVTSHQRVTFNDRQPEVRRTADSSVDNEAFRGRILEAIHRHREVVEELREVICNELSNGVYEPALTSGVDSVDFGARPGPGMLRWRVDSGLSRPVTLSPSRINLRKPIWFRDIRSNQ